MRPLTTYEAVGLPALEFTHGVLQNSDHPLIVSSQLTHGSDALGQEELTMGEKLDVRIIALLLSLPLAPLIEKLDDFAHGFPCFQFSSNPWTHRFSAPTAKIAKA